MLVWSIQAAQKAQLFDTILVSTDDEQIAATAAVNGAEVPFRRPAELCDDYTPTLPVIAHALTWFEKHRGPVEFACCIYATAPFLRAEYLKQGLAILRDHAEADFAFSVTSFAFTIFRALKQNPDGTISMLWPENELKRSQDLPEAWHDAGQFYWGRPHSFSKCQAVFSTRSYPVVIPRRLVQDIDTPEDWCVAESMFTALHGGGSLER